MGQCTRACEQPDAPANLPSSLVPQAIAAAPPPLCGRGVHARGVVRARVQDHHCARLRRGQVGQQARLVQAARGGSKVAVLLDLRPRRPRMPAAVCPCPRL